MLERFFPSTMLHGRLDTVVCAVGAVGGGHANVVQTNDMVVEVCHDHDFLLPL